MSAREITDNDPPIEIDLAAQELRVGAAGGDVLRFPISSSAYGIGTEEGSLKTPTGRFRIGQKIGHKAEAGTVFRGRVAIPGATPGPEDDAILSRILWLDGAEEQNRNTRERYVYIHGTNQEEKIGEPASHGCIRMRNADVIELFDLVEVGSEVVIHE